MRLLSVRSGVACTLAFAAALSSGTAHADTPTEAASAAASATAPQGDDAIYMKDGSLLRGLLVEMMPGDHASLKLATGQVAVVRWDVIARVERSTRADTKAPPPAVPTTVQTAGAGQALVHLDTDKALQIETNVGGREWRFACEAPCDVALDLDHAYRIVGDGVRTSPPFRIAAARGGRVVLDVSPGSKAGLLGGIVLASVGLPVTVVGGFVVLLASAFGASDDTKRTGWVVFGVGAGSVIGGVLLIVNNAHTTVVQSNGNSVVNRDAAAGDAFVRKPTWNDARLETRGLPAPAMVPLWSGQF